MTTGVRTCRQRQSGEYEAAAARLRVDLGGRLGELQVGLTQELKVNCYILSVANEKRDGWL